MAEVVSRRFARLAAGPTAEDYDESFAATPNLVVIDGGKGQLAAALAAMQAYDLPRVAVIALAKRIEEVFVPGRPDPVLLADNSPGLQLLRRVRDEAHRFAVTFHRQRRGVAARESMFDQLEGVGPARRRRAPAPFRLGRARADRDRRGARRRPRRAGANRPEHLRPAAQGRTGLAPLRVAGMRRLVPLLAAGLLVGCGGGSKSQPAGTTVATGPDVAAAMQALIKTQPKLAGTVRTLFQGTGWAVVQTSAGGKASAVAFHLVNGRWQPDQSGKVKVEILGPQPGAHAPLTPQIAVEIRSPAPFVEWGLWIDGTEVSEQGAGSATRRTVYGAPIHELKPGKHVAVGYARTAISGTAVAWVFNVD